jgi:hypothetical protein
MLKSQKGKLYRILWVKSYKTHQITEKKQEEKQNSPETKFYDFPRLTP